MLSKVIVYLSVETLRHIVGDPKISAIDNRTTSTNTVRKTQTVFSKNVPYWFIVRRQSVSNDSMHFSVDSRFCSTEKCFCRGSISLSSNYFCQKPTGMISDAPPIMFYSFNPNIFLIGIQNY